MELFLQPQPNLVKRSLMTYSPILALLLFSGTSFATKHKEVVSSTQSISVISKATTPVKGIVKDISGVAIPGVSVRVKGSKTGAVTDATGAYRLDLPKGDETLVFTSVGLKTQEVEVKGRSEINLTMEDDVSALNEVVVVGYAQQKKINLTGAVAVIDMKAIEDLPVGSLSAALVSQQPGVGVSGGTSRPGDNASITIRNPILLSKDGGSLRPLYVIDNVIRTEDDFNVLDVSEVENISILKDAAAAIYGARGAYGVVVVTTKRGKTGTPRFSYSTSYGTSDAKLPTMMNGYELATYTNDYNFLAGKKATDNNSVIYTQDELDYFKTHSQDWLSDAWKASTVSRHVMNVSGGTEKATYFAGITYNNQNGNFDKIDFNRWTFRASTDVKVSSNVRVGLGLSGDLSEKKRYLLKQGGSDNEKDYKSLIYAAPFRPAYVDGLPLNTTGGGSTSENFHFFEAQKSNNYLLAKNNGLNINAYIEYDIPFIKGLKAKATYNRTFENNFGKEFGTKYTLYNFNMLGTNKHIYGGGVKSTTSISNSNRIYFAPNYSDVYQLNGYLNYDRTFGKHTISAIALFEQSETYSDGITSYLDNLVDGAQDNAGYALGGTASGAGVGTIAESESESGRLSFAGRVNYTYAGKYLAEFAIRRDASTNFAPENRWGTFPSLSVGWVISEEPFFKNNVRFVDFLKLRLSGGLTGMDNTRAYNWLKSYNLIQTGNGPVFGGNLDRAGIFRLKNAIPNPDVQWDSDTKLNAGIDANFLNNRLSFGLDAFYDHRYNMLVTLASSVPLTVGAALPSENFATIDGFGTEISLGWASKINKDWSYKVRGFFSWSDNKQIKVDYDKGLTGTYLDPTGKSTDMGFLGLRSAGMIRTQADLDALLAKYPNYTIYGTKPAVGMLYYQDIRGAKSTTANPDGSYSYAEPDGKIDDNDRQYLTNKKDNHYGFGMNFTTSYKRLSFSLAMGGSFGGQDILESGARGWGTSAQVNAITNLPSILTDHWTPENPNAKYPAPNYRGQNNLDSDFWFVSSFQMSIRTLNVSYELPANLLRKLNVNGARIYLTSTNPLNLYNPYTYKQYSGSYDVYPVLRSFSIGLNLNL
ncbi:TonB-dependent receptor [Arcicella aquatica]|uniref:TonB-dependent receptor n=1 Tax=Arcicella aquatica TaxID=217141 RepID=A0ABU5QLA1_9BACT|nr:TonB-dependent receptor [Arcicella aquatica]MEA5257823.1 TonB-dependent receptor [Arcicella aquatica]